MSPFFWIIGIATAAVGIWRLSQNLFAQRYMTQRSTFWWSWIERKEGNDSDYWLDVTRSILLISGSVAVMAIWFATKAGLE